jgi:hypothetical protein
MVGRNEFCSQMKIMKMWSSVFLHAPRIALLATLSTVDICTVVMEKRGSDLPGLHLLNERRLQALL